MDKSKSSGNRTRMQITHVLICPSIQNLRDLKEFCLVLLFRMKREVPVLWVSESIKRSFSLPGKKIKHFPFPAFTEPDFVWRFCPQNHNSECLLCQDADSSGEERETQSRAARPVKWLGFPLQVRKVCGAWLLHEYFNIAIAFLELIRCKSLQAAFCKTAVQRHITYTWEVDALWWTPLVLFLILADEVLCMLCLAVRKSIYLI